MKPLIILMLAVLTLSITLGVGAILSHPSTVNAQSVDIIDATKYVDTRTEFSNSTIVSIERLGIGVVSGNLVYEKLDANTSLIESRFATTSEIESYADRRSISSATSALSIFNDPEPGKNYGQWIVDKQAELLMCETNMSNGQLMDFESLGANGKNSTIREIERCVELNANITRKMIKNLCDILTVQNIIICVPD